MIRYISVLRKNLLTLVLVTACLLTWGQEQQQQQQEQREQRTTAVDSIDVIRDYRPILADAVKIRRSPDMTNKREYQPKLTYRVLDKKLDITTGTKQLSIQEMPPIRAAERTDNYIKVGAGNYSTFLAEAYLANTSYQDTRFGIYAKHLNQMGNQDHQFYSQQEVAAFGRQLYEDFTVNGTLGYKRMGTRIFGMPENSFVNPDPGLKQTYNDVFLNAELTSNYKDSEEDPFSYSVKMDGYLYSNAFDAKENAFAISAFLDQQWGHVHFGGHLSGDFGQASLEGETYQNNIARIHPYVRFNGEHYDIRLGANLVSEFGDSSRIHVFPMASVDFALMPEYFHVFGGVGGDVNRNSFRDFSRENPWLDNISDIRNTLERFKVYGGFKGNAGATFGYKFEVFYKQLDNMAFFANKPLEPYLYTVIYEDYGQSTSIFGVEGAINLRISETVSLGGKINMNEYDLKSQEEAWYLPKVRLEANSRINISDRLYVNAEVLFHGQSYALLADDNAMLPGPDGPAVSFTKHTVPAFVDLSGGINLKFTERIGVFGRINNIFNAKYERYLYYPSLGMNILGGVNISF